MAANFKAFFTLQGLGGEFHIQQRAYRGSMVQLAYGPDDSRGAGEILALNWRDSLGKGDSGKTAVGTCRRQHPKGQMGGRGDHVCVNCLVNPQLFH